ncbi:uncharacterized protein LOC108103781 [Drosophila eugracilis]|uniref:uncharacterized protein LOC108103781 n=1 Tax=Drosophila eugracilis TaxID=29029 RepID=UPI001BD94B84|nr:uncharacterized protein LOC108103781 [Drosophila eugracilis]
MKLDLCEGNSLDSCWKIGGRKSRAPFDRNEIEAVNIVDCCKKITDLIDENTLRIRHTNTRNNRNVNFKHISHLAYGATNIYRCQVDILLGDTKLLLDQMKSKNVDFVLTTTISVLDKKSDITNQHKRKRVITKKANITISKRPRFQESEFLSEFSQKYYENVLSECQMWKSECTEQMVEDLNQSIELPRRCKESMSYHAFTITEEIQDNEDQNIIMSSDGFGDNDELDLTIFQELYPKNGKKSDLKKRLTTQDATGILPEKMPRLDELEIFKVDNAIMVQIIPDNIDSAGDKLECKHSMSQFSKPFEEIIFSKPKNSRKRKLLVDNHIKYTREQLQKHRRKYMDDYMSRTVIIQKPSEIRKFPNELLSKLNKTAIFSSIENYRSFRSNKEEMHQETENILRNIFGSDFSKTLLKDIFYVKKLSYEESHIHQVESHEIKNVFSSSLPHVVKNPEGNNNFFQHTLHYENINFGVHNVMMNLLNIWRKNSKITGIDAHDFIKSFESRFNVSIAFINLLYLVRDNFIQISKRGNSLEMDQITLGRKGVKLIDSF